MEYEDLRDTVMRRLRKGWDNEDSFKTSFSRSLNNLREKHLIKREGRGWYLGRTSLAWEEIALTKRGMTNVVTHCK